MFVSDIHGSAKYTRLLLERLKEEKPSKLYLLGDILYHGPRNDLPEEYAPKEVFGMLNEIKELCLGCQGNCDAEVDQMVLDFPIMAEYLVISLGDRNLYLTHGHHYNEHNPLPINKGDILMCGHTHVPVCAEYDQFIFMNPGSVSLPKENTPHSFMVLKDDTFYWKDVITGEVFGECTIK